MRMVESVAPLQSAIELAMDVVTVLALLGTKRAGRQGGQVHLMLGTKCFDYRITTFPGPVQQMTKLGDGNPLMARAEAVVGDLELPLEDVGVNQPCTLLLVVKP